MVATLKQGATKEYIRKLMDKIEKEMRPEGINIQKFCGTIKLKEDALRTQKRLRDEW